MWSEACAQREGGTAPVRGAGRIHTGTKQAPTTCGIVGMYVHCQNVKADGDGHWHQPDVQPRERLSVIVPDLQAGVRLVEEVRADELRSGRRAQVSGCERASCALGWIAVARRHKRKHNRARDWLAVAHRHKRTNNRAPANCAWRAAVHARHPVRTNACA